jgi:hypothetical protein
MVLKIAVIPEAISPSVKWRPIRGWPNNIVAARPPQTNLSRRERGLPGWDEGGSCMLNLDAKALFSPTIKSASELPPLSIPIQSKAAIIYDPCELLAALLPELFRGLVSGLHGLALKLPAQVARSLHRP